MQTSNVTRVDVIRSHVHDILENVYTMLPAIVNSYDSETQTVEATVATSQNLDRNVSYVNSPTIPDVPVLFPYGGNFKMGWTLKQGDNVMLVFSMRSLDEYLNSNGTTPVIPISEARHDLSDCVAIAGMSPLPTRDETYKDNAHIVDDKTYVVFNKDDSTGLYIETDKDLEITASGNVTVNCVEATVKASAKVTLDTPETACTGKLTVGGTIVAQGDVTGAGVSLKTHVHAHGTPNTSPPI